MLQLKTPSPPRASMAAATQASYEGYSPSKWLFSGASASGWISAVQLPEALPACSLHPYREKTSDSDTARTVFFIHGPPVVVGVSLLIPLHRMCHDGDASDCSVFFAAVQTTEPQECNSMQRIWHTVTTCRDAGVSRTHEANARQEPVYCKFLSDSYWKLG